MQNEQKQFVVVRIVTTSGAFPASGFDNVPSHQPVNHELKEAVRELKIKDTQGWVALVKGREIDPEKSYQDNGLTGQIVIDYGPREGGGGNA